MKSIFLLLLVMFTVWKTPVNAGMFYELALEGSDIEIAVVHPEGLLREEENDLDLVFQDPEDKGRAFFFHYFQDPEFEPTELNSLFDYTDWIVGQIFSSSNRYCASLFSGKGYATRSFTTTDAQNREVYCYVYVGKIEGELIFSTVVTSVSSLEEAIEDTRQFLNGITWQK
jgi:hypothetical protein